jgi:ankyrin repeat protein
VSDPIASSTSLNLEQQHKRAKDLFRSARAGDAAALAAIAAVRPDAGSPARPIALADAQFAVAREAGFDSWPLLVAALTDRDVQLFRDAVSRGETARVQRLLDWPHVRAHVNDPLFDFGQRAAHVAATDADLLAVLIEAGADLTLKSDWKNGPYTVLDHATEETARFLLARGATLTPNAAARLGWLDDLVRLVEADPSLVHARGGDGQQPLHEAKTVAIVDVLLDRGAAIDTRCIDHHATPAQYALADRPEVCRRLLDRGAAPDIYMAARLGDRALTERLLDADPAALAARIHQPGYAPVPPFHIYCWTLGFGLSAYDVARRFGHLDVADLLWARSPARLRLMHAISSGDRSAAEAVLADSPSLMASLTPDDHAQLARAIFHARFEAAELMVDLGFDPAAGGVDGGSALHAACWLGHLRLVDRLLARGGVGVDARDPTYRSTPLGWTALGSAQRRAAGGYYPAAAPRLVAAGADIHAAGNGAGRTLLEMAEGNPAMQDALRRLGAG